MQAGESVHQVRIARLARAAGSGPGGQSAGAARQGPRQPGSGPAPDGITEPEHRQVAKEKVDPGLHRHGRIIDQPALFFERRRLSSPSPPDGTHGLGLPRASANRSFRLGQSS